MSEVVVICCVVRFWNEMHPEPSVDSKKIDIAIGRTITGQETAPMLPLRQIQNSHFGRAQFTPQEMKMPRG